MAQTANPQAPDPAKFAILMLIAIPISVLAGFGASLFLWVEHELQQLLWETLPATLGQTRPAAWLVIGLLIAGALVVHSASKLPGGGGHAPLAGFRLDIGAKQMPSAALAALGTLSFGAVLGPEAPLLAVGTGLAALAIRKPGNPLQQVMMLTGAMAAVSAIFGNPLITAILLLEVALASGAAVASPPVLMASLTGMATSYVLQIGIAGWSGLGEVELAVPGLEPYTNVRMIDLAVAVPLAIVVAMLAAGARLIGARIEQLAREHALPTLLGSAALVGLGAILVSATTGGDVDLVLFSGQQAIPEYLALTSVGAALLIGLVKYLAYVLCLGSGFRGGPIFPAVAVGSLLAVAATLVVEGTSSSGLTATAIAAATVGILRLPFTGLLFGVMLTYPAGGGTTVLAVVGTVVAMVVRLAAERRIPSLPPPPGLSAS